MNCDGIGLRVLRWVPTLLLGFALGACSGPQFAPAEPPVLAQGTAGQVWSDGQGELAFEVFGERGDDRPAILFLHGWCENRGFWKPTAAALAKDAFCVTVDLPGYGGSGRDGGKPDPVVWAGRMAAFAREQHAGDWVVVGHSLGGVVALETARALKESARGVVVVHGLYDPARRFDAAMNRDFGEALGRDFPGQIDAFVEALVPKRTSGALTGWVAAQMKRTDPDVAVAGLGALENYEIEPCLADLRIPVRAINAKMRATNLAANRRMIRDFEVLILESIQGSGLDLMLLDPTGFRALLAKSLEPMGVIVRPDQP
ncbi:MAG: alpha/beta hydrolase [Planctomycetes bacterium]|nr:alpha/beta hydrolase [Planctomycetota bacterium]